METFCPPSPLSKCKNELYEKLDSFIDFLKIKPGELKRRGDLIVILYQAQRIFGYLSVEVQEYIVEKLKISSSEVSEVVNFFEYFVTEPRLSVS